MSNRQNINKGKINIYITWGIVILFLFCIYLFSSQSGRDSVDMSGKILIKVLNYTGLDNYIKISLADSNYIFRKIIHFLEYGVLGFLVFRGFYYINLKKIYILILSILFCAAAAGFDEFHQSLVPGRTPHIRDVIIDISGSIIGILISVLIILKNKRRRKNYI